MAAPLRLPEHTSGTRLSCCYIRNVVSNVAWKQKEKAGSKSNRLELLDICLVFLCLCSLRLCCWVQTYAIHVRDAIRKVERDYKLTTQNNTVEYLLRGLEPGGRYSVSVRLRNMSKEASFTVNTGIVATRGHPRL